MLGYLLIFVHKNLSCYTLHLSFVMKVCQAELHLPVNIFSFFIRMNNILQKIPAISDYFHIDSFSFRHEWCQYFLLFVMFLNCFFKLFIILNLFFISSDSWSSWLLRQKWNCFKSHTLDQMEISSLSLLVEKCTYSKTYMRANKLHFIHHSSALQRSRCSCSLPSLYLHSWFQGLFYNDQRFLTLFIAWKLLSSLLPLCCQVW